MAPRDQWIGWDHPTRKKNLMYLANNNRFLIVPWAHVKNLASKVLSLVTKRLPIDWRQRYGHDLLLLETLIESQALSGNLLLGCQLSRCLLGGIGKTKGRGKLDVKNEYKLPNKDIYVYPLVSNLSETLKTLNTSLMNKYNWRRNSNQLLSHNSLDDKDLQDYEQAILATLIYPAVPASNVVKSIGVDISGKKSFRLRQGSTGIVTADLTPAIPFLCFSLLSFNNDTKGFETVANSNVTGRPPSLRTGRRTAPNHGVTPRC